MLANALYEADRTREKAEEFAQVAAMKDEMNPDVAIRIDRAFVLVEKHAQFVFSQAFPCAGFKPLFKYTGVPTGLRPGHWTPADAGSGGNGPRPDVPAFMQDPGPNRAR